MASERDDTDAGGSDAESNDDLDAPRIAQWQDDEDDENHSQETESDSEAEHPQRVRNFLPQSARHLMLRPTLAYRRKYAVFFSIEGWSY